MSRGISAICSAQAIARALQQVQAVDIGVITAACSRALRQAEAYSSGVQVMLTMVSIDDELNEELSWSWSLARRISKVSLACKSWVCEKAWTIKWCQVFHRQARRTIRASRD